MSQAEATEEPGGQTLLPHWDSRLEVHGLFKMARAVPKHSDSMKARSCRSQLPVQEVQPATGSRSFPESLHSHRVIEDNILLGELQQHRIVEELADAHVFTQALPTTGFDHEFSGQVGSWLWLQGANDNALV